MKKRKSGKKFYVVLRRRFCGVFDSWDLCKSQVQCYENNRYQSFYTLDEAVAFLRQHRYEAESESGFTCRLKEMEEYFAGPDDLLEFLVQLKRLCS